MSLFACGSAEPADLPDDRLWESAHFRYHTRADDALVCEDVLAELERHFAMFHAHLGFEWSPGAKVDYFKYRDQDDFERGSACPTYGSSCVRDGDVLTAERLQHHELIHAYLAPLGQPPAFFAEGVAVALACRYARAARAEPWREVVAAAPDDPRVFSQGAWFVAHLLGEQGPGPFLDFYASIEFGAGPDEIDTAFAASYGEPLERAWARAEESGHAVQCPFLWECAGPPLALDGSTATVSHACDGSDAFRSFELESAGDALVGSRGQLLNSPVSCDRPPARTVGSEVVHATTNLAHFPAGRYFIGPFHLPAEVAVTLSQPPLLSSSCDVQSVFDLEHVELDDSHFEISIPNDGGPRFVRIRPEPGHDVCLGSASRSLRVEQCESCAGSEPACGEVACPAALDASGTVMLRLTPEPGTQGDISYSTAYLLSVLPF